MGIEFQKEYGRSYEIGVEVPGIATLVGVFSEAERGRSIMFPTDEGVVMLVAREDDGSVRIFNIERQEKKRFLTLNVKYRKEDRWANIIKGVVYALGRRGKRIGGADILIKGKGLWADDAMLSAELSFGALKAFEALYGLSFSESERLKILKEASSFAKRYKARTKDLRLLSAFDGASFTLWDERRGEVGRVPFSSLSFDKNEFMLFSPDLPPHLLSSLYEETLRDSEEVITSLILPSMSPERFFDMKEREVSAFLSTQRSPSRTLALFLHREARLVEEAWEAINSGSLERLAEVLSEYQKRLSEEGMISSPETDWLSRRAVESDDVGSLSLLYTGYGGDMVIIIKKGHNGPYMEKLAEYGRIFGFDYRLKEIAGSLTVRVWRPDENTPRKR